MTNFFLQYWVKKRAGCAFPFNLGASGVVLWLLVRVKRQHSPRLLSHTLMNAVIREVTLQAPTTPPGVSCEKSQRYLWISCKVNQKTHPFSRRSVRDGNRFEVGCRAFFNIARFFFPVKGCYAWSRKVQFRHFLFQLYFNKNVISLPAICVKMSF